MATLCSRLRALVGLVAVLFVSLLPSPVFAQATTPYRAGLIVVHGDGQALKVCVEFTEPEITGLDLLQRAGLDLNVDASNPIGAAICRIDREGCTFPEEPCFCRCQGTPCVYWSYWRLTADNGWRYSNMGAANTSVRDGDVDGWVWGIGTPSGATPPPAVSWGEICPPPTATPTATMTEEPPTNTPVPPTEIPLPPTATSAPPTATPLLPTDTPPLPTDIPTSMPPTDTPLPVVSLQQSAIQTPIPAIAGPTSGGLSAFSSLSTFRVAVALPLLLAGWPSSRGDAAPAADMASSARSAAIAAQHLMTTPIGMAMDELAPTASRSPREAAARGLASAVKATPLAAWQPPRTGPSAAATPLPNGRRSDLSKALLAGGLALSAIGAGGATLFVIRRLS